MSTPTSSPTQPGQINKLAPDERLYLKGLFDEAIDLRDPEQDEHLQAVAELVGDIALAEELRIEAWEDRAKAEALAKEFRVKRAKEGAHMMEARGFAHTAPNFAEQLADESRTAPFKYNNLPSHMSHTEVWPEKEKTEAEGLRELNRFLRLFLSPKTADMPHPYPEDAERAQSMLDNLTFIGEKELREAANGIGALWKMYLDADQNRKICVLTGVSNSAKYAGKHKSDTYLKNRILETFDDEDQKKYGDRIVDDLDDIEDNDVNNVRIILLDDWTISGQQLTRAYREVVEDPKYSKFHGSIEINLIVASEERIKDGLRDPLSHPSYKPMKVRAYYKAHHAEKATSESKSHVSGLHSTANFDFGDPIEVIVKRLTKMGVKDDLPALASIVSPYKRPPSEGETR